MANRALIERLTPRERIRPWRRAASAGPVEEIRPLVVERMLPTSRHGRGRLRAEIKRQAGRA